MSAGTLSTPIVVGTNEDLSERFVFREADGDPVNLDGYSATFGLRKARRGEADLEATSANDEVIIDGDAVVVLIPSERLDDLASGDYAFEVKITAPTGVRTVKVRGTVTLLEGIAP